MVAVSKSCNFKPLRPACNAASAAAWPAPRAVTWVMADTASGGMVGVLVVMAAG